MSEPGGNTREPSGVTVALEEMSSPEYGLGTMLDVPSELVTTMSSAGKTLPFTVTVPSLFLSIFVP